MSEVTDVKRQSVSADRRAEDLAARIDLAIGNWVQVLQELTPEQWRRQCHNHPEIRMGEDERRPIGVVAHHIAVGCAVHADMARQIADGEAVWMTTLDIEGLARFNATHAADNHDPDQAGTIALLQANASALAEVARSLSGEQLDRSADVYGSHLTTEQFLQRIGIGHGDWHVESIKATLAAVPA
ncbi:MAG: hypothetical protein ACRDJO_04535 [Actinomycetota bacterium]